MRKLRDWLERFKITVERASDSWTEDLDADSVDCPATVAKRRHDVDDETEGCARRL